MYEELCFENPLPLLQFDLQEEDSESYLLKERREDLSEHLSEMLMPMMKVGLKNSSSYELEFWC